MKDKPNGEDGAPVADQADRLEAGRNEADGASERRPEEPAVQETLPDEAVERPSEPGSPDELAPQVVDVQPSDLALPAPGPPDEPTFAGDPVAYVAEAPDGEPAVEVAWQPDIEPAPEVQSNPEFIAADDAVPAQPMQVDTAIETMGETPEAEPTGDVAPIARDSDGLPASDDPLAPTDEPFPEPTAAEVVVALEPAQDAPLAEKVSAEPASVEEEPAAQVEALPIADTPVEAPWPEHAPAELPTPDEPAADTPAEPTAEQPLRDRIPSVLPVEMEAIQAPRAVPVFEPPPRPPETARPTIPAPSHVPEVSLAAASGAAAAAILRRVDAIEEAAPSRPSARDITPYLHRALRLAALTLAALACLVLVLIVLYRWVNPPASTLMLGQWLTGTRIDQRWVPLNRISPYLRRAVITSEDGRFCQHHGVDWSEIEEAIERARDGIPRGGSTISMQVVKNLFLWPSKSYVRKALEFPLTFAIELAWSKPRILEIYLNIAEWGPGVFGAEAAARHHFRKSAATLTPSQAALLAVSLPNPIERRAGAPGPGTLRLANTIHARMMASPGNASCILAGR